MTASECHVILMYKNAQHKQQAIARRERGPSLLGKKSRKSVPSPQNIPIICAISKKVHFFKFCPPWEKGQNLWTSPPTSGKSWLRP